MDEKAKKIFQIRLIEMDIGTQAKLAKMLGVSKGMITHLIQGRRKSKTLQRKIARVLNIDPQELWMEA